MFKDHKFLKSFPNNSFYNLKQFSKIIKTKNKKNKYNFFFRIFNKINIFDVIEKSINNLKQQGEFPLSESPQVNDIDG